MNNTNDINEGYNDLFYPSGPVKFSEFVTDKYNKVHQQLYADALTKLIKYIIYTEELETTVEEFRRQHRFIELRADEYWKPSSVIVMTKRRPYTKKTYNLRGFWNLYQHKNLHWLWNIKQDKENKFRDSEIIYLNYLTGKAILESRVENHIWEVDFDYIDEHTFVSEEYSNDKTFAMLLK